MRLRNSSTAVPAGTVTGPKSGLELRLRPCRWWAGRLGLDGLVRPRPTAVARRPICGQLEIGQTVASGELDDPWVRSACLHVSLGRAIRPSISSATPTPNVAESTKSSSPWICWRASFTAVAPTANQWLLLIWLPSRLSTTLNSY